jgi:Eco57I restriction-modification methylase
MALSDAVRNALRNAVQRMREQLTTDLADALVGTYGVRRDGTFQPEAALPDLQRDPYTRETRELLERILPMAPATKAERERFGDVFDAVLRSLAFTHLNRLVAFKLMEHPSRKIVRETVGKGIESRGFKFYLADHPDDEALWKSGQQDTAYRRFLLAQCDWLNQEIGILFDPDDLASRIFPKPHVLNDVLKTINGSDLAEIWEHEEAIGWVYQYYTPKELREKARKESPVPRNSWEMAFRNQFYTPHYVVRFLTDNTLGRIWLEMKPDTSLRERCTMLVIRPDESTNARPKKDPREIRIIDPACGSGHFLLYAFELLEVIYREAWDDADLGPTLHRDFTDQATFEAQIPASIVEHNLHGIDIDKRAVQLASLTLLLKAKSRSRDVRIERSGLVCAEPMPGGGNVFEDFKTRELPSPGQAIYAAVLDGVREHLALADEAGSLLLAEREMARLIAQQHDRWRAERDKIPMAAFFGNGAGNSNGTDVSDEEFWERLEHRLEHLLESYAERAHGAEGAYRRIFARDGTGVLRFLDVLRKHYDVALMNPPFGAPTKASKSYIEDNYPLTKNDVYAAFVERWVDRLVERGRLGAITSRTGFFLKTFTAWREQVLLDRTFIDVVADLGGGVLDTAMVETAAYVLEATTTSEAAQN